MKTQYLRSIKIQKDRIPENKGYPFELSAIKHLHQLDFHENVTFIIGENGTGKSTLIEALAIGCGFNPEGGSKNFNFKTRDTHSPLSDYLTVTKGISQPKDGYFLRAESFYNTASNIDQLDEEMSFGPPIIDSYGGKSLHEQSHGESFFSLFQHRLYGDGLYIFDEPEAALSPQRQMSFLVRMHELIKQKSQFIIATHSPILLAYPEAKIIEITADGYQIVQYKDSEHYQLYKMFLNNPEALLKKLGIC